MRTLTEEQAAVLNAFLDAFELAGGFWVRVEQLMRDDFGIADPEAALEDARQALDHGRG